MNALGPVRKLHCGGPDLGRCGTPRAIAKLATCVFHRPGLHARRRVAFTPIYAAAALDVDPFRPENPVEQLRSNWRNWWAMPMPSQEALPPAGKLADLCKALVKLVAPDGGMLGLACVFLVIAAMCELAIPHYISKAIFSVASTTGGDEFRQCLTFLAGATLGYSACAAIRGYLMSIVNIRVTQRLRQQLFNTLIRQEVAFFDAQDVGSLTSRLSSDCGAIARCLTVNINVALRNGLQCIAGATYLFMLSPQLTTACLAASSFMWVVTLIYGNFSRAMQRATQDVMATCNQVAEEALTMSRTVRALGAESLEEGRYMARLRQLYDLGVRQAVGYSTYVVLGHTGHHAARLTALLVGGTMALQGAITPQQLTTFVFYTESITSSALAVCDQYAFIMESIGASERVLGYLDRPTAPQLAGGQQPDKAHGALQLQDVSFWYPERKERPALSNVSLNLVPGQVTALVGLSGSGKTTLVALLQRLYDPTSGRILLDGRDLRDVDSAWFRGQLGVVSQEPRLFSGDLAYNISYGCPREVGQAEIEAASHAANAHDFIMALPQGYATQVTDKLLSGGQRQRIALARALLREPAVLILDEATSALDSESEAAVQAALDRVMAQRSRALLVVAHRLSTVRNADTIVVLDRGQIVEQGSHDVLVASGGIYARLVARQMGHAGSLDLTASPTATQAAVPRMAPVPRLQRPGVPGHLEVYGATAQQLPSSDAPVPAAAVPAAVTAGGLAGLCRVPDVSEDVEHLGAAALQSYDSVDCSMDDVVLGPGGPGAAPDQRDRDRDGVQRGAGDPGAATALRDGERLQRGAGDPWAATSLRDGAGVQRGAGGLGAATAQRDGDGVQQEAEGRRDSGQGSAGAGAAARQPGGSLQDGQGQAGQQGVALQGGLGEAETSSACSSQDAAVQAAGCTAGQLPDRNLGGGEGPQVADYNTPGGVQAAAPEQAGGSLAGAPARSSQHTVDAVGGAAPVQGERGELGDAPAPQARVWDLHAVKHASTAAKAS